MASAQLTDRQKQIVDLQKDGKKASEIAQILGITPNGVYQQIRRMRDGGKAPAKARAKVTITTSSAPTASGGATSTTPPQRPVTPLQSIRMRRDEITSEIKSVVAERDAAERALAKATEATTKVQARYAGELDNLANAEAALTGGTGGPTRAATPKPSKNAAASTPRPKASAKKPAKAAPAVVAANEEKVAEQPTPPRLEPVPVA